MSGYLLEMRNIVKQFGGVRALNGIDIKIRKGECVGLCGENGAGKSTLINGMSMLDVDTYWQMIVKGAILTLAVWVDVSTRNGRP